MSTTVELAEASIRQAFKIDKGPLVDRWLRFDPAIDRQYNTVHGPSRAAALREALWLGIFLYNAYTLTGFVLLTDYFWESVLLRSAMITPIGLFVIWLSHRVSSLCIERSMMIVLPAYFVPVLLFWLTRNPLGHYAFGELFLTIVYSNMMLVLRYRYAVFFTASALGVTILAVYTNDLIQPGLQFAFLVQIAMTCFISLYSNYRTERRRCDDYLVALGATLQADSADAARREFQDLSRTDSLTELPNRRYLSETLDDWFAKPDAIALIMVDIDHFKLYNDGLGHMAGDQCLRRVARVLAVSGYRDDVFCARLGGEEFVIAVRGATQADASALAKTLLQSFELAAIPHPGRPDGVGIVTVSLGIALRPLRSRVSQEEMFAAADRALYDAKTLGRNRFVFDEDLLETFARSA